MFDLDLYDNVIYLNKFHLYKDGTMNNIIMYSGFLNKNNEFNKKLNECYYLYTDDNIENIKKDIENVFIVNYQLNIIHIHANIFINDKLFLDYIDIPNNILIHFPNNKIYNNYFKSLGFIYKFTNNTNLIYINNDKFRNIKPYSNLYNYFGYFFLKDKEKQKYTNKESDYFDKILLNIFYIYNKYKYNTFPYNDFEKPKYYNSKFQKDIIDYLYPNLKYIDKKYQKDIINNINSCILKIFNTIKKDKITL